MSIMSLLRQSRLLIPVLSGRLVPVLLFMATFPLLCHAVYFENLSIEQGLSQNTIYAITQDKYGYLWAGSVSGLNRYDGVKFKIFGSIDDNPNSPSALSEKHILDITKDENGDFWIGTYRGLTYFNIDTYKTKHYFHDPQNENSLSGDTIRGAMIDATGYLWIGTNNGLTRLNPRTEEFKRYHNNTLHQKNPCSNVLGKIAQDSEGYLWLSSVEKGLCKFDPKTEIFSLLDYRNNPDESASISTKSIIMDENNIVWIGSDHGLFKYDIKTKNSTAYFNNPNDNNSLPNNSVQYIIKSGKDYLWIGTLNGLSLYDKKKNLFKNFHKSKTGQNSIASNDIYSLFIDQSGLLWIGTQNAGLNKYNPKQAIFHYIGTEGPKDRTLSNLSIWTMINAYGYIWIATNHGLNRLDRTTGTIKHYFAEENNDKTLVHNTIYALAAGQNRDLWIGSRHGVSHFYIDSETFENFRANANDPAAIPFNNTITAQLDKQGNLWLGFYGGGAALYNPKTKKFIHFKPDKNIPGSIRGDTIDEIFILSDEVILLASNNGINKYDSVSQTFKLLPFTYQGEQKYLESAYGIKQASNKDLLIAAGSKLIILNKSVENILEIYAKKEGLDSGTIYAVEEDNQGHIWVSTDRGLSRINRASKEVTNFDIMDGLQDYEFNSDASLNDGTYLYFGGINGVNYFNPNEIKMNTFIPPIVITNFSKNGNSIDTPHTDHTIKLSYKDTFFSIEFSIMDFTDPKKNQYAYKLEGFDKDWTNGGTRNFATYTNIGGGNYTFRVKGANKYGIWNEVGASIKIQIDPPLWKRGWAYMLYLVILSFIFFLATRSKALADSKSLSDRIRKMSTSLTQTLDLATIYKQLAEHLKIIFPYRQIIILIRQENIYTQELLKFIDGHQPLNINKSIEDKLILHVAKSKQPLLLKTPKDFASFGLEYQTKPKLYLLVLPLITRDDFVGVVILANPKQYYAFREDRMNIAITLGAQASAAIDNAHLFSKTNQLAFYDPLTGLENRQLFKERLELALKVVTRNSSELAVMFLDLDKFKRVNDSLGHDVGDTLLIEAARRLKSCVRRNDTVARIGGDEFTVLLTDINGINGVNTVANKILGVFKTPINISRHSLNVSTSIGISLAPRDGTDATGLMKNADVAMYKAKEKGRNTYQFFTEEMNIQASNQLLLENDIRRALAADEFILHYQPLVDLSTYTIVGVEALVRWNHPEKGLLPPMDFIPAAEETGLITALGEQILIKAFAHAKQLHENHFPKIRISVNLSARQFIYGQLTETITQLLKQYAFTGSWLELEITENVLIENTDKTIEVLFALKNLGCTLSIDDFGTGYSSLSYLKQLPIDTIKIDRSFVKDIPHDLEDTEITAAIIAMAHNLKLTVVAEGVETIAQLEFLQQRNCDIAQGYYFHKPMPGNALITLLKDQHNKKVITHSKIKISENL